MLGVAALALTVLAGGVRDVRLGPHGHGGRRRRSTPSGSGLAGAAVLLGVATVLCLSLPAADVPDQLVTDPATGLQTVVTREGPQALLERPGLALLGGLLLAGAVVALRRHRPVAAPAAGRRRRPARARGHRARRRRCPALRDAVGSRGPAVDAARRSGSLLAGLALRGAHRGGLAAAARP